MTEHASTNDAIRQQTSDDTARLEAVRIKTQQERKATVLRRLWFSFLSVLAVLIVAEALARIVVVLGQPTHFGTKEFDLKYKIASVPPSDGKPALFFLGSSYTSRGVYADLIEKRLNDRGYDIHVRNIGSQGCLPMDQLFLLETAVNHGTKPAAVIYELVPLALDAKFGPVYSSQFSSSHFGRDAACVERGPLGRLRSLIKEHSFLCRYRPYLKDVLSQLPQSIVHASQASFPKHDFREHVQVSPAGWLPDYSSVSAKANLKISIEGRTKFLLDTFDLENRIKQETATYIALDPVRDFCKKNDIPFAIQWLPIHPEFITRCENLLGKPESEIVGDFTEVAQSWNAQFFDYHKDDDSSHFVDCDHLNVRGAAPVSELIADGLTSEPGNAILSKFKPEGVQR